VNTVTNLRVLQNVGGGGGSSWAATQLAASQEGLSSTSELPVPSSVSVAQWQTAEDDPKFYLFQGLRLSRPKCAVTETHYNRITWLGGSPSRPIWISLAKYNTCGESQTDGRRGIWFTRCGARAIIPTEEGAQEKRERQNRTEHDNEVILLEKSHTRKNSLIGF
jgi:hypothetical protein